jgi:hypothetical protein
MMSKQLAANRMFSGVLTEEIPIYGIVPLVFNFPTATKEDEELI